MYKINFDNKLHVYFMGIGGISMSGMAELLHKEGFTVSGSDAKQSNITKHLESLGITIFYEQAAKNITKKIDLIVYTAAIKETNPEFMAAKALEIPMLSRAELVGQVMSNYKHAIGVSGTHGKTTTTSMLSMMLLEANVDPTISVGGVLEAIHGNMRVGNSDTFITEACEYTNSFLHFQPTREIILNIEAEHLDFFKDLNDIRHSFKQYVNLLPEHGTLVINGEIDQVEEIYKDASCNVITYGLEDEGQEGTYNVSARNITYNNVGCGCYDLYHNGEFVQHIQLSVVGRHNVSNSLSAVAMAMDMGLPMDAIQDALLKFTGTHRRFEYKGEVNGVTIIDDYAHHPTEIKATLTSALRYPHKEIWVAFQPHTYTRTKKFLKEFGEALSHADHIVLADIYAAREKDPGDISSRDIMEEIKKYGKDVHYFPSFSEIEKFLWDKCTNGDLLITMGAGDIVLVGEELLKK